MLSSNKLKFQLIGVAVLLIVTIFWWNFSSREKPSLQTDQQHVPVTEEKFQAQLYFTSSQPNELVAENRLLPKLPILENRAKLVMQELVLGPKQRQFHATIPPESQLREFYLDEHGCAYLDFDAKIKKTHPGGAYAELLTISSLVKTITANFDQIKQVKLLINGAEIETLAGHIDTRFPFTTQNLSLKYLATNS